MNRRMLIQAGASTAFVSLDGLVTPARAFAPPLLIALGSVAISVAFRRYAVGGIIVALTRLFPSLFATELRKYLMAVAVAFGISEARAAVIAEHAENAGAQDLARDGVERVTEISITNTQDDPLEFARLRLLLVDVKTNTVELMSTTFWGLVVLPNATMQRQIATSHFPRPGLKRWYLSEARRTLRRSEPFMVIARGDL